MQWTRRPTRRRTLSTGTSGRSATLGGRGAELGPSPTNRTHQLPRAHRRSVTPTRRLAASRVVQVEALVGRSLLWPIVTLLELASPPALRGADERIGPTLERSAALHAVAHGSRVLGAIRGPSFGVQAITVPLAPVPRRCAVALPTAGRDTEVHPHVAREPLERKPFGAPRTALLRHGLNAGHCFCATFSAERFSRGKLGRGLHGSVSRG
jgi:hypothetical protein